MAGTTRVTRVIFDTTRVNTQIGIAKLRIKRLFVDYRQFMGNTQLRPPRRSEAKGTRSGYLLPSTASGAACSHTDRAELREGKYQRRLEKVFRLLPEGGRGDRQVHTSQLSTSFARGNTLARGQLRRRRPRQASREVFDEIGAAIEERRPSPHEPTLAATQLRRRRLEAPKPPVLSRPRLLGAPHPPRPAGPPHLRLRNP